MTGDIDTDQILWREHQVVQHNLANFQHATNIENDHYGLIKHVHTTPGQTLKLDPHHDHNV